MAKEQPDTTDRLRDAITGGTFLPRQRLIEADLEGFLGATRLAIRQALLILEQEGLVVREPNRGATVRSVSDEEAVEIVELRSAIEPLVAGHAALNATKHDVDALLKIIGVLETQYSAHDLLAYAETNVRLHNEIIRIANHRLGTRLLRNLRSQLVSYQYHTVLRPGRAPCSVEEHRALFAAIAAGDQKAAEVAMRTHLEHAAEALKADIKERGARRSAHH